MNDGGKTYGSILDAPRVATRCSSRSGGIMPGLSHDWVLTFVEGDGNTFDFGVDYIECGLCKYTHAQGADELTQYLCLGDFPASRVYDTGLVRTMTLACGGPRCDFRFKRGRPIEMEWTPDFLKE